MRQVGTKSDINKLSAADLPEQRDNDVQQSIENGKNGLSGPGRPGTVWPKFS